MTDRPVLGILCADTAEGVNAFVAGLQAGHHQRHVDILNQQFAADLIGARLYGALVNGQDQLHPVHMGKHTPMRPGSAVRATT